MSQGPCARGATTRTAARCCSPAPTRARARSAAGWSTRLPQLVVLRDGEWDCPVIPLLAAEIGKDDFGQEAVLDRLLDLLVVAVLRAWFARPEGARPRAGIAHRPIPPPVRRCGCCTTTRPIRGRSARSPARWAYPGRRWARRFTELVGEPPIGVSSPAWRLALAADPAARPRAPTVGAVARQVGYASPFHVQHGVQAALRGQPGGATGATPWSPRRPEPD